jgi:YihY family inner membrane protein
MPVVAVCDDAGRRPCGAASLQRPPPVRSRADRNKPRRIRTKGVPTPAMPPTSPRHSTRRLRDSAAVVIRHPLAFALRVLKGFKANQGLLLAGAVAYYTLLSLIPLLIVVLILLSRVFEAERILDVLRQYLEFVVPGQATNLVAELRAFLDHQEVIGPVLFVTMLFFSALAFTVLENAMSVIFFHRVAIRRRRFLVSALLPYLFIVFLTAGLTVVTVVSGALKRMASHDLVVFGEILSLANLSSELLYLLGVAGEILVLTAIYLVMPVGRLSLRHALLGGVTAGLLWEMTRHMLVWYYGTISQIQVVYGSLTTAIVVLLSVEIAGIVLLLGAQVIAEYERVKHEGLDTAPKPMKTTGAP